jgi:branched-chain amino acid transport system permease protein
MSTLPCGTFNKTYAQDMAIVRTRMQWVILLGFFILLFTLPLFLPTQYVYLAIYMGVTLVAALGLNILTGYCGQISIGQSAFMAVGAFTAGILIHDTGIPFWLALPISGIVAGIIGLFFGIPSLRIKGLYLALATLAAQFIITFVIANYFKGNVGVTIAPPSIGRIVFSSDRSYYYIVMVVAILLTFFAKNIVRTRTGRAFIAIRDNDIAAETMGINIFRYKLLAFFIGCFYAGIAGDLWSTYTGLATLDYFSLTVSIFLLGMIVVGGTGSIAGTIFGVIFIRGVDYGVQLFAHQFREVLPSNIVGALSPLVFGLILLLFIMFEPRGLAHRWEKFKISYRSHPWAY